MITLLLATHNPGKVRELQSLLAQEVAGRDIRVLSLSDIGYREEIVEDGDSFFANALIKARVGIALGYITVADDSGLMVDALGGAPGIYSARYAGENATDADNNRRLCDEMKNVPDNARTARFVSIIVCAFPDGRSFSVSGQIEGEILRTPRGEGGFGYDSYFFVPALGKTLAEATPEEKNAVSHRGEATRALCRELPAYLS